MAVIVRQPTNIEQYVDTNGKLTQAGLLLLQQIVRSLVDHEERIVALEP